MNFLKLLNKKSYKYGIKLLLTTVRCSSFLSIIIMFLADILWISVVYPFIHHIKSKEKATDKVNALKFAMKDIVSARDYLEKRNALSKKQV